MIVELGRGQLHAKPQVQPISCHVARTGRRITQASSDEGLWQRPKRQGKNVGCVWSNSLITLIFRSSSGNNVIDGTRVCSVHTTIHLYVHKKFFWFRSNLVCGYTSTRCADQYDLDPIQHQGQGHGASEVPKNCTFLGLSPLVIFAWSSKLMVGGDSMGPRLQLVGARFSNFLLRKLSHDFKLCGMSILHEFQMATFPYCLRLRSHGRECW